MPTLKTGALAGAVEHSTPGKMVEIGRQLWWPTPDIDDDDDLPPSVEEVAAGLVLDRPTTSADLISQAAFERAAEQREIEAFLRAQEEAKLNGWDLVRDVSGETLTAAIFKNLGTPTFEPDPNWTFDRYQERFKAAMEVLPEDYWEDLHGARSEAEFDWLFKRALAHVEAQKRIASFGLTGIGANILAQLVDPASWAVGNLAGSLTVKAFRALTTTRRLANIATHTAAGATGGLAVQGLMDQQGIGSTASDYLMVAGLGAVLGAAYGALSRNPAVAREAARLQKIGEDLQDEAAEMMMREAAQAADPPPSTQASVKRAEQAVREAPEPEPIKAPEPEPVKAPEVVPIPEPVRTPSPEVSQAPEPTPLETAPGAVARAVQDVAAAAQGEPINPAPSVQKAVEEVQAAVEQLQETVVQQAAPEAPSAAPVEEPGLAISAPEAAVASLKPEAAFTKEVPLPESALQNIRNIAQYAAPDGAEYRIVAETDDLAGPYRIIQIKPGPDGQRMKAISGIETLAEARAKIPGIGPAEADEIVELTSAAGAQQNLAVTHDFLQDPNLKSVKQDDAPKSAGFWRFDLAGVVGKSENALGRLIGSALLNDTVGKVGHLLNPFSADLDYRRIMNSYMVQYDRTRRVAFKEWADDLKLSPFERWTREHEFYELVGHYIRTKDRQPGEWHPAVKKLGDKVAQLHAEILKDLKNPLRREGLVGRPVYGAELVKEDAHYLWRRINPHKVRGAIARFGESGVVRMVAGAIRAAQNDLDEATIMKLATGYVRNIHKRAVGLGDEWSLALGEKNFERFKQLLREDTELSDPEIEQITSLFYGGQPAARKMENLKRRLLLSEDYVERGLVDKDGNVGDLAFTDLIDNNVNNLFERYVRRAAGRIALGRVRIKHPRFGDLLVNGITSDAEWDRLIEAVKAYGADSGLIEDTAKLVERLQFAYDRIKGVPHPEQIKDYAQWFRLVRAYMSTRLMGQVGIAQLGEAGQAAGALGVRAAFSHVPGFRRIIDAAGDTRLRSALFDELESIGIGVERLHGLHFHNLDEIGELPFSVSEKEWMERALNNARLAEKATYELSGMSWLQQMQERWVAAGMAQRIANMAERLQKGRGLGRSDTRRLAQLGIDEPMLRRILDQMAKHTDQVEGPLFGRRLNRLNLNQWTDLEARAAFEDALFRSVRKIIQNGEEGSMALWMSHPVAQTIFQFRSFVFTAWANQFLYGIHMGDFRTLMTFTMGVAWAAAVRGAQVKLLAAGRSDSAEYEDRYLSAWELGKAGFERSGWSSIIPMAIDTALMFAGQPGQFHARTSGQAQDILFGSPAMSFIGSAATGTGGVVDSLIRGRPMSQAEVRALVGILPFSNLLPVTTGLSYLIQELPERAPPMRERNLW